MGSRTEGDRALNPEPWTIDECLKNFKGQTTINRDKDASPHVRLCGKFTEQPHVHRTYGKRVVWIFFLVFF